MWNGKEDGKKGEERAGKSKHNVRENETLEEKNGRHALVTLEPLPLTSAKVITSAGHLRDTPAYLYPSHVTTL